MVADGREEALAVALELAGADAVQRTEFEGVFRPGGGHFHQGAVVEDDVGGVSLLPGKFGAEFAQG